MINPGRFGALLTIVKGLGVNWQGKEDNPRQLMSQGRPETSERMGLLIDAGGGSPLPINLHKI